MKIRNVSDRLAIFISRIMASWVFIITLVFAATLYVLSEKLFDGPKLDTFNLSISLYTIFVELIILKATLSLRDMDRGMMDSISKKEDKILKHVSNENTNTKG